MKKRILLMVLLCFATGLSVTAQQLLKPFESVSHKKTTYITMDDGTEVQGTVKDLDRKKGLIEEIKIKTKDGKKKVVPIDKINFTYLPQSGLDKLSKGLDFAYDVQQWDSGLYDQDRLKDGYAFFEKSQVMVKKKERTLLMQLLNPGTCSRLKVYHDPFARETMSLGVAGMTMAGGDDKSYYIRKDDGMAVRVMKKNYDEQFDTLFGDCAEIKEKYGEMRWKDFVDALTEYNTVCKK